MMEWQKFSLINWEDHRTLPNELILGKYSHFSELPRTKLDHGKLGKLYIVNSVATRQLNELDKGC